MKELGIQSKALGFVAGFTGEAIEKGLCLGCSLAEQNINADNCEYREKSGLDMCKKILEGEQMKISERNIKWKNIGKK